MSPPERRLLVQAELDGVGSVRGYAHSEVAPTILCIAGLEALLPADVSVPERVREVAAELDVLDDVLVMAHDLATMSSLRRRFSPMFFRLGGVRVPVYAEAKSAVAMMPGRMELGGYASARGLALLVDRCARHATVSGGLVLDLPRMGWRAAPPPWRGVAGWMGSSFALHNSQLDCSLGFVANQLGLSDDDREYIVHGIVSRFG